MKTSRLGLFLGMALLASASASASGCASTANDANDGGSAAGSAPIIRAFTLSTTTLTAGKLETLSGEFTYEDVDADVSQFEITIKAGAQTSTLPKSAVQNAGGMKSGKAAVAIALQVPQAGPVEVRLIVTDSAGHSSNELRVSLTAQ